MTKLTYVRHLATCSSARAAVNRFTTRSHNCGELGLQNEGQRVELYGWLMYNRLNKFLVLRDAYGLVQLHVPDTRQRELAERMADLNYESTIKAVGVVRDRGANRNGNMQTGDVEVHVDELEVLNRAPAELPLTPKANANERTRLAFRYLDLRTAKMQRNLRLRSTLVHNIRRTLVESFGFVDVETPTLAQWTPGGAQEFPVPCGKPLNGLFYSLPQSPQIYKQLLMCGGIDRYFQIARCYRDEGARTDRQPEFTQVDLELSFTTQEHVLQLLEQLVVESWPVELADLRPKLPFRRLTYADVMRDFGSDKPDLRIPWTLRECTKHLQKTPVGAKEPGFFVACFVARKAGGIVTNAMKREWKRVLEMNPSNQAFEIANFTKKCPFNNFDTQRFIGDHEVDEGDLVVFSWGNDETNVRKTLGQLRNFVGDAVGLRAAGRLEWAWIVDFPLFVRNDDGRLESAHHPFTAPASECLRQLEEGRDLEQLKAQHYDLVLNGVELGGGSIRIHRAALQRRVFELLQLPVEPLKEFVEALGYGAPPHGGFAFGLDRLLALLAERGDARASIRDVIAFPKTKDGKCLMLGAPAAPPADVLERYGMRVDPPAERKEDDEGDL